MQFCEIHYKDFCKKKKTGLQEKKGLQFKNYIINRDIVNKKDTFFSEIKKINLCILQNIFSLYTLPLKRVL